MTKIFNAKNIAIAIITLAIGTFAALGAAKLFFNQTATVSGNVVAFILNLEGKVDGAVLDSGDQVRFGAETGEIVTSQVKIGSSLTATGKAGSKSDYGRELRAETLQIGDQTINISQSKPKPPRDGRKPGPRPGDEKMPPPPAPNGAESPDGKAPIAPPAPNANPNTPPAPDVNAPAPVAPLPLETASANGQVKVVLVGAQGEPRGLILNSGEQIDLPKEVSDANLAFNQGTEVSAEGDSAKSDFGKFIHPLKLTIGNQTFSFNR